MWIPKILENFYTSTSFHLAHKIPYSRTVQPTGPYTLCLLASHTQLPLDRCTLRPHADTALGGRAALLTSDCGGYRRVTECHGFVNRSAIGVGAWRFVEGGEHGGAIWDGGSTSLPSFRSRNGGETLRAAIIHYMATSARLQWWGWLFLYAIGRKSKLLPQGLPHAGL
jgi:hypothetical protein